MEKLSLKKLSMDEMVMIEGGTVTCSRASGWIVGAGIVFCLIPGLLPLGIVALGSGVGSAASC